MNVRADSDLWALAHELKQNQDNALLLGDPISFQLFAPQYCSYLLKNTPKESADIQWTEVERIPEALCKAENHLAEINLLQGQGGFGASASFYLNWHGNNMNVSLCYATRVLTHNEARQLLKWSIQILAAQCAVELEPSEQSSSKPIGSEKPRVAVNRKGAMHSDTTPSQKPSKGSIKDVRFQ